METLLLLYLIIGCTVGLIIWFTAFDKDYDQFVRDVFREEPPSNREKIVTILFAPILWPLFLWYAFR